MVKTDFGATFAFVNDILVGLNLAPSWTLRFVQLVDLSACPSKFWFPKTSMVSRLMFLSDFNVSLAAWSNVTLLTLTSSPVALAGGLITTSTGVLPSPLILILFSAFGMINLEPDLHLRSTWAIWDLVSKCKTKLNKFKKNS